MMKALREDMAPSATETLHSKPQVDGASWDSKQPVDRAVDSSSMSSLSWSSQSWKFQLPQESPSVERQELGTLPSYIWCEEDTAEIANEQQGRPEDFSERPTWDNKVEYLLAQMGFSVGLSSVWRFPFLCYHNGSGAFVVVYTLMLLVLGCPLLLLEMAAGQRFRQGSIGVWKCISPSLGGLGFASLMVCLIVGMYYSTILSWIVFYLIQSFQYPLPWMVCPSLEMANVSDPECERTTPTMYFWYHKVLKAPEEIEKGGLPVLHLSVCLFLTWLMISASILYGLKFTGKMLYISVLLPYVLLMALLSRCLQMEGAFSGLKHLLRAEVSSLLSVEMWRRSGSQIFYALGLGFGSTTAISSYSPRSNNCVFDAYAVSFLNLATSMVVTLVVFSILGHSTTMDVKLCNEKNAEKLAYLVANGKLPVDAMPPANVHEDPTSILTRWLESLPENVHSMVTKNVPICNLTEAFEEVTEGPGMPFVAFSSLVSEYTGTIFWVIFIFLLLFFMGLSTMVGIMQGITTPLQDTFALGKHTKLLTVGICVLMILSSLLFTGPSGSYYISLLDDYWAFISLVCLVFMENVTLAWIYGARRFLTDLMIILGYPISSSYRWLWGYISPVLLMALFVTSAFHMYLKTPDYMAWNASLSMEVLKVYPSWAMALLKAFIIMTLLPIPIYYLYITMHTGGPTRPFLQNTTRSLFHLEVKKHLNYK